MTPDLARLRLVTYRFFLDHRRAPAPGDLATETGTTPGEVIAGWKSLATDHDALVMLPDSDYLWMAEPFSAVPTGYIATATDGRTWFGNCIWDALGILVAARLDGSASTVCKASGVDLQLTVTDGDVTAPAGAVIHFAVPASEWWKSIGFT